MSARNSSSEASQDTNQGMRMPCISERGFPLFGAEELSWDIGLYMTISEERANFPRARTVITAMSVHRPDQLARESGQLRFDSLNRVFGHNAARELRLIDEVLSRNAFPDTSNA